MVIQRWQSVWLLIASLLMAAFCVMPFATVPATQAAEASLVRPLDMPVFFTVTALCALLLFLAIFMFKDTRRQKRVTLLSIVLIAAVAACCCCVIYGWGESRAQGMEWMGSIFLLLGALIFAFMALAGIRHDERLLHAADRLR